MQNNTNSNNNIQIYKSIGLMSGSSLDGLDIAYNIIKYNPQTEKYEYKIEKAETISYPTQILENLRNIKNQTPFQFMKFDREYGKFLGQQTKIFMDKHNINEEVQFVCSHGHTIFHSPTDDQMTVQIGHISHIAAEVKKICIGDFRSMDVALGGQGAPLVPIGDELLFNEYQFCINFGGIANLSFYNQNLKKRTAFDICPCNILINYLANMVNLEYDKDGQLAQKGKLNQQLLEQLQNQEWMLQQFPKSLDREYVQNYFYPIVNKFTENNNTKIEDIVNTVTQYMAQEISKQIINNLSNLQQQNQDNQIIKVLCTGGGAYNKYLINNMQTILQEYKVEIIIPDNNLVEFKEALLFSFLGVCTLQKKNNSLKNVTGAIKDSIGGQVQFY